VAGVKRILREIRLGKIAAVDFPCQEHAMATIIKRAPDESTETDGGKMAKALFGALRKSGLFVGPSDETDGAENFDEVIGEQEMTREFWDDYYNATNALQECLMSILKDDTATDKSPLFQESIKQFADYIEQIMPGQIGKSLAEGITALAKLESTGVPMSDELKKALGLPATATEAEMLKAVLAIASGETATLKADLAKALDELEKTKAKMQADAKGDLDGDEVMAKALRDGDAFKAIDGRVIMKAKVGDDVFAMFKSQNDLLVKQGADLAKARDREEEATFAKRATDLGMTAETGAVMRKAYAGDPAAQATMETLIKGLVEQVETGALFKNFGHNNAVDDSAGGAFMAKVAEVKAANPALTDAQAYSKAYTAPANRDIVKRMKSEAA